MSKSNGIFHMNPNESGDTKPEVYLEETFYILSKKNTVFRVRLSEKGLSLRKECNGSTKEQTIAINDIVGCRCMRSKRRHAGASSCVCSSLPGPPTLKVVDENSGEQDENDVSAYLYIYAYILKRNRRGGKRERTTITLRFRSFDKYDDNNKEAQKWRIAIKCLINNLPINALAPPANERKLLVLLNPKSGAGKARECFQQRVAPILVEAELPYDLQVTKHANYAKDFIRQRNVYNWRGIIAVGGDGIFFEVINGIFERPDWEQVLDEVPLGIMPCGSGNGLARTVCHLYE